MGLSNSQKNILGRLLDKYERSKQCSEGVDSNRAIMIKPVDIYKDYDSDFADVDAEHDFERDVFELKNEEIIDVRIKEKRIYRIVLMGDSVQIAYNLLGREPQKDLVQKQLDFYKDWLGHGSLSDRYCNHQIDLLKAGKKAKYETEIADNLLKLLDFIFCNDTAILERELSIAVFSDTKVFENEYRSKLIYILKTYGEFDELIAEAEDEKEAVQIIFEELNIYANPRYVYFKGEAEIEFENGIIYKISRDIPLALPMDRFKQINSFVIENSQIMTVENLASYNRINPEDCFCIYLAGYHNSAKQALIKMIDAQNCGKKWLHFGDIDPDGFMILENLKRKTGIDFSPINMGIIELQEYKKYVKPLQTNDIKKAQTLITKGLYVEVMQYMLTNNLKLEQEVISWNKSC